MEPDTNSCLLNATESKNVRIEASCADRGSIALVMTGAAVHHEFLPESGESPIYDQQEEITVTLGSGSRGRAYLLEREGRLFASPVNWYARTGRFDLAPGYPPRSHIRFEREVGQGYPLLSHAHEWLAQVYQVRRQNSASEFHRNMARKLRQSGF